MSGPTNQTYPCSICGKTYQRKSHLSRHEATHGDVSRYECHACHKNFSRSDVWRKHCIKCPRMNQDEQPPRLARGRKPGACEQCFRSKVTCDKADPCGRCQSRQLQCTYIRLLREGQSRVPPSSIGKPDGGRWRTGAMFLLSLTDPMAANMLESFTDDGPSDITSDDASSIGAEPVLVQEDDIFLQSLCNFIFDPVLLNMGNLEMSTTLEDTAARPAATIFQPEALGTLQVKSESAVQDLHALHEELAVNDESYSGLFAKVTVQQALSPESIIRFTTAYFHLTHHHIPIVYRQSFGSHDTATTLLLAVTLAGALRSPPQDDALSVRSLARLFEEYIFRYLEDIMATYGVSASPLESKWLLETLQAAILVNNVQFMVNNVVTRRRIRSRRLPVLVSVVRRLGPFAIRHSPDADGVQYLHEESCIRIAHWTAMADWHQSVMFHLPPLVSISELTGDMPDLTGVWDADNIPGPGHKSHKQQESSPRGPRSVRDCIQTLMQDQIPDIQLVSLRQLSISNLYLIILGLSSAIISANHMCTISPSGPAIKRALTRWQDIWKLAVNNMRSDAADASGIERYSDGQSWAARKMLEALVSGDELHPYLRQAGHETLAEFHSFLLESQKAHDAH